LLSPRRVVNVLRVALAKPIGAMSL